MSINCRAANFCSDVSRKTNPCFYKIYVKAGERVRTVDNDVGNVVLYQLSYARETARIVDDYFRMTRGGVEQPGRFSGDLFGDIAHFGVSTILHGLISSHLNDL